MLSIRQLTSKFTLFLPIFLLILLEVFLFKANYKPDTWLIGWDTTQPELNFRLNLFRILNSIWQEYRGVGLLDGMSHASNLLHWVYTYILSLFLAPNLIRYVFVFLMHFLGGLGMFLFLKKVFKNDTSVSFFGAIFYLLNPATIQIFYAPLELYIIHFAFLPWLFWVLINFLTDRSKKNLILFFLVNLFSVSQFHVPSVFLVYLFGVLVVSAFYIKKWKNVFISGLIIFLVNSFWIMPYIYSAGRNAKVIVNSKINKLSNPEVILMNRSFGDLKSVVLLHGFNLDYGDWDIAGSYGFQMPVWRNLWQDPKIELLGYILFSFAIFGILASLFRKQRLYLPFVLILFFVFSNLATDAPIFSKVVEFLGEKIPFYEEIFRFSFTKFAVFYVFCLSMIFGAFFELFSGKIMRWFRLIVLSGLIGVVLAISWPAFRGEFLYDRLRLKVPNEYFEIFKYFNSQKKDGRVTILPQPSFWNWEYLRWGYRGSGFIWQGISKPTLHRSFDPWSFLNETYFNELNYAIIDRDKQLFNQVLKKYEVRWIVLDEYIYHPGEWEKDFFVNEVRKYLENNPDILLVKNFGRIKVYEFGLSNEDKYISAPEKYVPINAYLTYSPVDSIYQRYGDYIQDSRAMGHPFVNFDSRGPLTIKILNDLSVRQADKLEIANDGENAKVILPTDGRIVETFAGGRGFGEAYNCDLNKLGKVERQNLENSGHGQGMVYKAESGGISCDFFKYPDLKYNQAYILRIKGENKRGRSLKIYSQNWTTSRMDLEELLPTGAFDQYFMVLPKKTEGGGYTLNLETRSFGRIASENIIEKIEIYPINYQFLSDIYTGEEGSVIENNLKVEIVKKFGTAFYKIQTSGDGLLVLGQGYEEGWKAFPARNLQFKIYNLQINFQIPNFKHELGHVKVNSWANGWIVPSSIKSPVSSIWIIFWPQLLEWLGFIILFGCLVAVISLPVDKLE